METNTYTPGEDLLNDEDLTVRAGTGARFCNYLIDVIVFYVIMLGIGVLMALITPYAFDDVDIDSPGAQLIDRLVSLIAYALIMGFSEAVFKGKTIGKFITGTRAVNLDGSRIASDTAFLRGLSRAVPFCVLSAFGSPCNPWQDKWTNTKVVYDRP
ncbi:MAG: RDD family protein [Chitinophagaceae bacterium]|nr:MAG: RDD family protein [Chitinophagaceae bacterium]